MRTLTFSQVERHEVLSKDGFKSTVGESGVYAPYISKNEN